MKRWRKIQTNIRNYLIIFISIVIEKIDNNRCKKKRQDKNELNQREMMKEEK